MEKTSVNRCRYCQILLVAIGMLLLGNLYSYGRTPTFAQKENYMAYMSGYNKVHFRLPLYDCNLRDRWANEIYVTAGTKCIAAFWTREDHYNECTIQTYNSDFGKVQIWTTSGYQDVSTSKMTFSVPTPGYSDTDASYVELEWYVPAGKAWEGEFQINVKGQYRWYGDQYGIGSESKNSTGEFGLFKANFTPSEKPEVSTVMPSYEASKAGTFTAAWYVAANEVNQVEWKEDGKDWTTLPDKSANGALYFDAYVPHKNVQVRATYKLPNGVSAQTVSNSVNINMIHKPENLKMDIKDDGNFQPYAQISWTINNPSEPDFYDNDIWEIQRNASGNLRDAESWLSIGTVAFQNAKRDTTFTFKDDGLLNSFDGNFVIYYRIRRVNTAMWGWNEQSGYALDSVYFTPAYRSLSLSASNRESITRQEGSNKLTLHLPLLADEYEKSRPGFEFRIAVPTNGGKSWYGSRARWVWDDKVKFKLIAELWQKGQLVGTQATELKIEDIMNGDIEYEMTKPFTYHKFKVVEETSSDKFLIGNYKKYYSFLDELINCPIGMGDQYKTDTLYFKTDEEFYFEQKGEAKNLKAENRHTYIHLSWEPGDIVSDYYRVYRKVHGTEMSEYTIIRDNVTTLFIDDKTAQPCDTYDYYVEAVTKCDDTLYTTQTSEVTQNIDKTGTVNGYVRMPDGTGISGLRVTATPIGDIPGAAPQTVTTDSVGYYSISGLVYQSAKGMAGSYSITVEATDGSKYIAPVDQAMFNKTTNLVSGVVFTLSQTFKFTGAVYYEGSSIPVMGASFKVDGNLVYNSNGTLLTTDNTGEFIINVAPGSHSIQVVKENHHFADDGMLIDLDAADGNTKRHNFQKDLNGYYFWDETKIRVKGRIAGGINEGSKPMGQWETKNIIGSNMQMVLQLDGDNSSYIYRDNANTNLTQKVEENKVTVDNVDHEWTITRERHRLVINPDSLTGEFLIDLYPVKWKMTQLSCDGYVTLIQSGKVGEIFDLTDSVATAEINYIFHSDIDFEITQLGQSSKFAYYGNSEYNAVDVMGRSYPVVLAYEKEGKAKYTFGNPVFMEGTTYAFGIEAGEYYYFNNNRNAVPVVVPIPNGEISVRNQLVANDEGNATLQLDTLGSTYYTFLPNNMSFSVDGENALRSISFTLDYNGAHYDSEPINGYLIGMRNIQQGTRFIAGEVPMLFDILRDPPGSESSATLSKGAKLSCAMNYEITGAVGVDLDLSHSTGSDTFVGTVGGPITGGTALNAAAMGEINSVDKVDLTSLGIKVDGGFKPSYSYEYTVDEDISTSSSPKWIGSRADIYMGFTDQFVVSEANAVRAIPKYVYDRMPKGDVFVIKIDTIPASDLGAEADSICYLVRDKVMACSDSPGSFFYYTQDYIEKQLLPDLYNRRNSLLLPNTIGEDEAQSLADKQGKPVYLSKKAEDDELFGAYEQIGGKRCNTWKMILPNGYTGSPVDEVEKINTTAGCWLGFLAQNEKEKLEANELVKSFDFDGSTSINYSESFSGEFSANRYLNYPSTGNYDVASAGSAVAAFIKVIASKASGNETETATDISIKFGKSGFGLKVKPIAEINYSGDYDESEEHSRTISFSLGTNSNSNLNVDVYRVASSYSKDSLNAMAQRGEICTKFTDDVLDKVTSSNAGSVNLLENKNKLVRYGSFVYRTRGGMTREPWEEKQVTKYYMPGTTICEPTIQIDHLRMWADKQEISNVPMGEPARFTVHFRNDTDYPQRTGRYFNILSTATESLKGAKVMCEGAALINPITLEVLPGNTVTKVIEIYGGDAYDYEEIPLSFYSDDDVFHGVDLTLAAHFVPSAGSVNISSPGDKWVLNTFGQYDAERADHYMPVRIDGYDTNFRGFDHIELQYKKNTEGDKDWVNLCSFYADEDKMAIASGTRKLIGNDGYILERFYGDRGAVEQSYDLRAVTFCAYGSGYLTKASNIISGTKDTRYPTLFGTPQPINGSLGIGDYIRIPFSENIASNDLSKMNNFQVIGRTNSSNIVLSTSLRFQDEFAAFSEFERNLAEKSFTVDVMLDPDFGADDMCFFSHGNTMSYVKMYVTADKHLKAVMKTTESVDSLVSDEAVDFNGMHQVAMTYDKTSGTLRLYDGNKQIGSRAVDGVYVGQGALVFGTDYLMSEVNDAWDEPCSYYNGDMIEFRLWNRVLAPSELNKYAQIHLTGYEYGLLDNYPMNEGYGSFCEDKGPGRNNVVLGGPGHFTLPKGISFKLSDGLHINGRPFYASEHEDFTLMAWFRTTDADGVLLANGDALDEGDKMNHVNIGVADGSLYYRHGGKMLRGLGDVSDGAWHHIAVTENNTRNVGNIYVDGLMKESFTVDTIGGISYNDMTLGACPAAGGALKDKLTCNIDELGLFNMVLSENTIKRYMTQTPNGQEMGLRGWLSCSAYERQNNNIVRVMPSGVSLKRYRADGIVQEQRDTIVAFGQLEAIADRVNYASMTESEPVDNIDFSYVVKDNELVINLGESDDKLERTNVYVTVKDIPDLRGNLLQSPVMMDLYVYRAPLRWKVKQQRVIAKYLDGATFDLVVENVSGKSRDYEIKGLPEWLTVSQTSGTLSALGEETLTFTVNPNTNVGVYDEQLYICDADGISEPLPLIVSVMPKKPEWSVSDDYSHGASMQIVARVKKQNNIMHDADDILVARDCLGEFMGVCNISVDNRNNANEALAYLTVSTNRTYAGTANDNLRTPLSFWFFDASSGNIYVAEAADTVFFSPNTTVGTPADPLTLDVSTWNMVQAVELNEGWNWMSLYVDPTAESVLGESMPVNVAQLLDKIGDWKAGDAFCYVERKANNEAAAHALVYTAEQTAALGKNEQWSDEHLMSVINGQNKYDVYVSAPKTLYVEGYRDVSSIVARKGWNRIAYNMPYNMTVDGAMADYLDKAKAGDVLKSHDAFAMVSVDANGNKTWKGNLQYMVSGQGYMLYRNVKEPADSVSFSYPMLSEIYRGLFAPERVSVAAHARNNMSVVARALDIAVEEGDTLVANCGGETRGLAVADAEGNFYMTVGGETGNSACSARAIDFALLRDGDVVATAVTQIPYNDNGIVGSPSAPVGIDFGKSSSARDNGIWYDVSGLRHNARPQKRGVYISNGKKLMVK